MEISGEKNKLVTNKISASTKRSKYPDRSLRQSQTSITWAQLNLTRVLSRMAQTTAALRRLKPVWIDRRSFLSVPKND